MPGNILHVDAMVMCSHAGTATPAQPSTRVSVGGKPILTLPGLCVVAGCALPKQGPYCQSATWTTGATRVTSDGQALVITGGSSTCLATGEPLRVMQVQGRVTAT